MHNKRPIGVFDSGYGGLTILKDITERMPSYDYIYLGDNARAPYGNRSFQTVYEYTLQSVKWFFSQGCQLVILACNTASAKALRNIQQNDLPHLDADKRVLGVIRPTSEVIGKFTNSGSIGILGTTGTILSKSYLLEIEKFFPALHVFQQDCPMWVPLIENNEYDNDGAGYFIKKNVEALLTQSSKIDTILLACTHYPLLINQIEKIIPNTIKIISQGKIVAEALTDYLKRHIEIEKNISQNGIVEFFTTDAPSDFNAHSLKFYGSAVKADHIDIS